MRIRVKLEIQVDDGPLQWREINMGSDDYPNPEHVAPLTVGAVLLALNEELKGPLKGHKVFPEEAETVEYDGGIFGSTGHR